MKNFRRNIEGDFCYCQDLINGACGLRTFWMESFVKINKRVGGGGGGEGGGRQL